MQTASRWRALRRGSASRIWSSRVVWTTSTPKRALAARSREAHLAELVIYPNGGVGCHTVSHLARPYLADWISDKLGGPLSRV